MRDWLNGPAEIPDDSQLATDLTGPQYNYSPKQQLQLERKEVIEESRPCLARLRRHTRYDFCSSRRRSPSPQAKLIYSFPDQTGQRWMQ
jgi:hypothetical protein